MTSSNPPARLADYFYVVGIHDKDLLDKYEIAKSSGGYVTNESYFNMPKQQTTRKVRSATLDGTMLDHVNTVMQNFDKDRDIARDTVIAVWDGTGPSNRRRSIAAATDSVLKSGARRMSSSESVRSPGKSIKSLDKAISDHECSPQVDDACLFAGKDGAVRSPEQPISENDKKLSIFDAKFPPAVLLRYPKDDYSAQDAFPSYTPMVSVDLLKFCFPDDISLKYGTCPPAETVHSFSITDEDGNKKYGTCVRFYERLSPSLHEEFKKSVANWIKQNMSASTREYAQHLKEKIDVEVTQLKELRTKQAQLAHLQTTSWIQEERDEVEELLRLTQEKVQLYTELLNPVKLATFNADHCWVPKSVGVISQQPWFELLSDWIRIVIDAVIGVKGKRNPQAKKFDLESAIFNLIHEVKLPPRGIYEIGMTINDRLLYLSRPCINDIPILKNFSLYPLFRCLSPHLILAIMEVLLTEGKVIFLSKEIGILSIAGEGVQYLLYPLYWQFVYIPVLPRRLSTCLQAPVPYIIGFHGSMEEINEDIPEDACVVNLDTNTIHQMIPPPTIPIRQRRKLLSAFEEFAALHTRYKVPYGIPLPIREAYPNGRLPLNCSRSKTLLPPEQRRMHFDNIADSSPYMQNNGLFSRPLSDYLPGHISPGGANKTLHTSLSQTDLNDPVLPQRPGSAVLAQINVTNPSPTPTRTQSYTGLHSRTVLPPSPGTAIMSNYFVSPSPRTSANDTGFRQFASAMEQNQSNMSPSSSRNGFSIDDNKDSQSSAASTTSASDSDAHDSKLKKRLSTLMSKPKAAFQEPETKRSSGQQTHSGPVSSFGVNPGRGSFAPMTNHFSEHTNVQRRTAWIEGHGMTEIFNHELVNYAGYRCICGKEVSKDSSGGEAKGTNTLVSRKMFMGCKACKLITHEACTNQILHPCTPACFDEQQIICAFLRLYSSLLWNYRAGFAFSIEELDGNAPLAQADSANVGTPFPPGEDPEKLPKFFSKERFLKGCDRDTRDYLSQFVNSQMFTQFITDRLTRSPREYEVLLFDEIIKLKLNRSKLKLLKEETPFLDDEAFAVSHTVWATPPGNYPGPSTTDYQSDDARFPIEIHSDMLYKTAATLSGT